MVRPLRFVVITSFLMGLALPYVWSAAPAKKQAAPVKKGPVAKAPVPQKKSVAVAKSTAKKAPARAVASNTKKRVASRSYAKTGRRVVAAPVYRGQATPAPERYQEIQQVLVDKGYLQSVPSGTWDAQTTDAMRRFQADKHLPVTGTLNSMSLIQLGLGPKRITAANNAPPVQVQP